MSDEDIRVTIDAELSRFEALMTNAGRLVETVTAGMDRSTKRVIKTFEKLEGSIFPAAKAAQRLERDTQKVTAALGTGAVSSERAAAAQKILNDQYERAIAAINRVAEAAAQKAVAAFNSLEASLDPTAAALMKLNQGLEVVRKAMETGTLAADRAAKVQDLLQAQYNETVAAAGRAALAAGDRATAAFNSLEASLDPAAAALLRLNTGLATVDAALQAGVISANRAANAQRLLNQQFHDATSGINKAASNFRQLEASLDPVVASQVRLQQGLDRIQAALRAGVITTQDAIRVQGLLTAQYQRSIIAANGLADANGRLRNSSGRLGNTMQNVGWQVGDFATQVSMGTNVIQALTIQGGQLLGVFGAWGAMLGAALVVFGALGIAMWRASEGAKQKKRSLETLNTTLNTVNATMATSIKSVNDLAKEYRELSKEMRTLELIRIERQLKDQEAALEQAAVNAGKAMSKVLHEYRRFMDPNQWRAERSYLRGIEDATEEVLKLRRAAEQAASEGRDEAAEKLYRLAEAGNEYALASEEIRKNITRLQVHQELLNGSVGKAQSLFNQTSDSVRDTSDSLREFGRSASNAVGEWERAQEALIEARARANEEIRELEQDSYQDTLEGLERQIYEELSLHAEKQQRIWELERQGASSASVHAARESAEAAHVNRLARIHEGYQQKRLQSEQRTNKSIISIIRQNQIAIAQSKGEHQRVIELQHEEHMERIAELEEEGADAQLVAHARATQEIVNSIEKRQAAFKEEQETAVNAANSIASAQERISSSISAVEAGIRKTIAALGGLSSAANSVSGGGGGSSGGGSSGGGGGDSFKFSGTGNPDSWAGRRFSYGGGGPVIWDFRGFFGTHAVTSTPAKILNPNFDEYLKLLEQTFPEGNYEVPTGYISDEALEDLRNLSDATKDASSMVDSLEKSLEQLNVSRMSEMRKIEYEYQKTIDEIVRMEEEGVDKRLTEAARETAGKIRELKKQQAAGQEVIGTYPEGTWINGVYYPTGLNNNLGSAFREPRTLVNGVETPHTSNDNSSSSGGGGGDTYNITVTGVQDSDDMKRSAGQLARRIGSEVGRASASGKRIVAG